MYDWFWDNAFAIENTKEVCHQKIKMTDKSLRSFSVSVSVAVKILRDQTEIISHENTSIIYYKCVCVCVCVFLLSLSNM